MDNCEFFDDLGRAVPAVDAAEMLEVDRIAIEETGPNLYQMMENAGRNLALTALAMLERLGRNHERCEIAVLAGTGGNGGGGITAGRHLMNHGVDDVTVVVTDPSRLGEVPAQQLELFRHAGGEVFPAGTTPADIVGTPDLIVDAVIGYSLNGTPRGRALEMIQWANNTATPVLSLDVPSGLDATTGEAPGAVVEATHTMTLALPKRGLCSSHAGELSLADIGIPVEVYRRLGRPEAGSVFNGRYRVPLERSLGGE